MSVVFCFFATLVRDGVAADAVGLEVAVVVASASFAALSSLSI